MIRTPSLSRLAPLVAILVPLAAVLPVACGGSDYIVDDGGGSDSMLPGGQPPDGEVEGASAADTGTDVTVTDAPGGDDAGGSVVDGSEGDGATDAHADGGAGDASHGEDASDGAVALDASDGAVALDASDASDASDATVDASSGQGILGSAAEFAVFSGATVQNATGTATTITGDLGTYPSNTAIGLTPPVVVGSEHLGDGVAAIAAGDIQIAYDALIPGNLPCGTNLTGFDLGGRTLVPGVYCFSSSVGLTGTLTLDAQNDPGARWVFQIGSTLTTASASQVVLINGTAGQVCNAYWQVSSSATLGTNSVFGGNILASAAVTITTGTSVLGRTFGLTAEVSTDTNILSIAGCAVDLPILDAGLPDAGSKDAGVGDAHED